MGIVRSKMRLDRRAKAELLEREARKRRAGEGFGSPERTVIRIYNNYVRPTPAKTVFPGEAPEGFSPVTVNAYPEFDDIGDDVLRLLGRKNWKVPGILVEMKIVGTEAPWLAPVTSISGGSPGEEWRIEYRRDAFKSGSGVYLNTAVSKVHMPRQEIWLPDSGPGPVLYRYCGASWIEDEVAFSTAIKAFIPDPKIRRCCLEYHNSDGVMVANTGKAQPEVIPVRELYAGVRAFFKGVFEKIDGAYPDEGGGRLTLDELLDVKPLPAPEGVPELIAAGDFWHRSGGFVHFPILPFIRDRVRNDLINPFPEKAYDSFRFAYPSEAYDGKRRAFGPDPSENDVLRINLEMANDVYVADEDAYWVAANASVKRLVAEGREHLDDAEVDQNLVAFARSMVPLSDYKGNYEKLVYLIGRPIRESEATDVTNEWRAKDAPGRSSWPAGWKPFGPDV